MSRHYWPEPPKDGGVVHLVEHKSGSRTWWSFRPDGKWVDSDSGELLDNTEMRLRGYLGVLKPFSEEAERAAFEAKFPLPQGHDEMDLHVQFEQWRAWLAAKRHERGL